MNPSSAPVSIEPFVTEKVWTVDGIPVLSANISLPQPLQANSRTARRIRRYYRLQCRSFLRYCEKILFPQAAAEYHAALLFSRPLPTVCANMGYHITLQKNGLWSLYTQSEEVGLSGQPHILIRRGDTWDLDAGYPVPLQAFFPENKNWKQELLRTAETSAGREEAAGVCSFYPNWRKLLRRHFNPHNFYLTENGLTIFYPMFALAPAEVGIPTFTVPLSSLQ